MRERKLKPRSQYNKLDWTELNCTSRRMNSNVNTLVVIHVFRTRIQSGGLKTRDWKTWDQIAGVEKAGLENA